MTASWPAISTVSRGPVGQYGPGERRHIGDRAARGIGLIFTHDPKALLAAIIPAQGDGQPKGGHAFVSRGLTTSAQARRALQ